ncbi:SusC/RagA family TonB-linked outer membrane protein [Dysgonomonas sp.]
MKQFDIGEKNILNKSKRILNIVVVLLIAFICSSNIYADSDFQNTRTVFRIKAVTIKSALEQIERSSNYVFVISDKARESINKKTDIDIQSDDIDYVLGTTLKNTGVSWRILDNQVVIYEDKSVSKKETEKQPIIQQPEKSIKGKVVDKNNEPLIGVSVKLKQNNSTGTITDVNGEFTLTQIPDNAILVITYIGMKEIQYPVKGTEFINIVLEENTDELNEVVVVGYGVQRKINLTGAVDAASSKAFEGRAVTSVAQGLQGVIPNLNISMDGGSANSAPSFNIRGTTSIYESGPLILIDNLPASAGELSRINMNDIENISVLKDASSAAIYGARGAFGVILVTTKTAKSGKLDVNVNAYYSTRKITELPEIITDPYQVMKYKNEAAYPLYNPLYKDNVLEMAKLRSENPNLPAWDIDPNNSARWIYFGQTNWLEEVYKNSASMYNINASVSQRSEKGGAYLSAEYAKQDGMFKVGNDIYNRYNIRLKADYRLFDRVTLTNNTSFSNRKYDKPTADLGSFFHQVNRTPSFSIIRNPDGTWTQDGAQTLGLLSEGGRNVNDMREFSTSFGIDIDLIKKVWLIKGDANFRLDTEDSKSASLMYTYKNGPDLATEYKNKIQSAGTGHSSYNYYVFNLYTDFHKTFGNHYVQALVGVNQEYKKTSSNSGSRDYLISSGYPTGQLATGTAKYSESYSDWAIRGLFTRLNYSFKNRYLLEFSGRYDGSSKFPKEKRFGFFPSGSLGWILSEEDFMKSMKETIKLDFFKLRVSYGKLGNQAVSSDYAYLATMQSGQINTIINGERPIGINAPGLASRNVTWEKVSTTNFGVDIAMLKQRLSGSFDYYIRDTKGMLAPGRILPNVIGASEPKVNAADLRTRGWELSVQWRDEVNLLDSPFGYSAKFIIADSQSEITKYDNPNGVYNDYYKGKKFGEIWGLTTEGFFQNEDEIKNHADQTAVGEDDQGYKFYVGDLKFKDLNNDNKIDNGKGTLEDSGDFRIIGNTSKRYPYAFDFNFDWKGFDLRAFFQGVGKRDWYPNGGNHYFWGIYAQPWTNVQKHNLDHWTPENPNAYYPRVKAYIAESTGSELAAPQTRYLQDASYLRLKNITFGYTLPTSLSKKVYLNKVRVYFSGENLWVKHHLKANLDPEIMDNNSGSAYPLQKSFTFGININL